MKHLREYQINDRLPVRKWHPNELQLRQYAEASGDFNPIHLDAAYARRSGLDGIIAHGMLTMAQLGAMLMDWMGGQGTLGSFEVRFKNMVRIGEVIECSGYVKDKLSDGLVCELVVTKSTGEQVLSGSADVTFKVDA